MENTLDIGIGRHHVAEAYVHEAFLELGLINTDNLATPQIIGRLALEAGEWVRKGDITAYCLDRSPHLREAHIHAQITQNIQRLRQRMLEIRLPLLEFDPPSAVKALMLKDTRIRLVASLLPEVELEALTDGISSRMNQDRVLAVTQSSIDDIGDLDDSLQKFVMKVALAGKAGYLPHPNHRRYLQKIYKQLRAGLYREMVYKRRGRYYAAVAFSDDLSESLEADLSDLDADSLNLNLPIIYPGMDESTHVRKVADEREMVSEEAFKMILDEAFKQAYLTRFLLFSGISPSKYGPLVLLRLIESESGELKWEDRFEDEALDGISKRTANQGLSVALDVLEEAELVSVERSESNHRTRVTLSSKIELPLSDDQVRQAVDVALMMAAQKTGMCFKREHAIQCWEAHRGKNLSEIFELGVPLSYKAIATSQTENSETAEDCSEDELYLKYARAVLRQAGLEEEKIDDSLVVLLDQFLRVPMGEHILPRQLYLAIKHPDESIRHDQQQIGERVHKGMDLLREIFEGMIKREGITGIGRGAYFTDPQVAQEILLESSNEFVLNVAREILSDRGEKVNADNLRNLDLPRSIKVLGRLVLVAPVVSVYSRLKEVS